MQEGRLVGKTGTSRIYRVANQHLDKSELKIEIKGINKRISTILRNSPDNYNKKVSLNNAYKLLEMYKNLMTGL